MGYINWFNEKSKGIKILLMIPIWGWIFGFLYRLFDFIEKKETASLIGFILFVIPITGFILSIVDIVTIITDEKIKFMVSGGENFGISGKVTSSDNTEAKEAEAAEEKAE